MLVRRLSRLRVLVSVVALSTLAAGCSTGDDDGSGEQEAGSLSTYQSGLINVDDSGSPQRGGDLTFAAYAEPAQLDPSRTIVAGSTGGTEMAAIFDVLMRYDEESGKVVPQLAASLTPSDDFTTWTLELRDDVTFSDGTPLDAAAVVQSINRYVENGGDDAAIWKLNVTDMTLEGDRAVVFTLAKKWPTFDFLFTLGVGQIVAASSDAGDEFTPVGAGPFTFASRAPQENLVLEANPDYWQGPPPLDTITISYLNDPNAIYDSFESGSFSMAFLSDAAIVDEALAAKTSGYMQMVSLGSMAVINAKEGHPGADVRVRQAIQMAIDPKVVAERTSQGAGVSSSDLFPDSSQWHSDDVGGLPYDPEQAKELLAAAKADGYDGKISYLASGSAAARATGVAYQAFLNAVGFDATVEVATSISDVITKVAVEGDYDMSTWSFSWREVGPFARMFATSNSAGALGVGSATSPKLDELIEKFQGAETTDERRQILSDIQVEWNEIVPALIVGPKAEFTLWQEDVHGVKSDSNTIVLLDEAWIG